MIKCVVIALALISSALGIGAAAAQPYPSRPITMVVPFAAGGPTDVLARILAQSMSQTLGQQIVIENVTGAGGSIAAARVAKAPPDGYTMILGNLGTHAASVALYKNLSYDPRTDFEPVMLVATTPMVLLVRKSLPVETLNRLIAYAKEHPRKVSFGSAGTGSVSHLTYLLFTHLTNTEIQHVPYRGSSQVSNDLLAGQIDMTFEQAVSASQYILSGAVKPLAVTAPKRAAVIPDVPSTTEAGLPDLQTIAWTALFVPKATPQPIVERINASVDKAVREETTAKRMADLGADLPPSDQRTPQALGTLVRSEIDKWVPLIKAAGAVGE
jgi:tripartite-type tricarboxylate transporter receptor subunit TctC